MRGATGSGAAHASISALDPLLLAVDGGFDAGGGARIFAHDLAEGGAGGLLLLQCGERLSEPQERIGRLRRLVVLAGDIEEDFGGVAILLALEVAFAEPVLGIAHQGIVRIFLRKILHRVFGERVVLALHVADAEIVFVARRVRGRRGDEATAGAVGIARRRGRRSTLLRRQAGLDVGAVGEVERRAGYAPVGHSARAVGLNRHSAAAQGLRGARRVRVLGGIEGIAATAARRRFNDRRGSGRDLLLRIALARVSLLLRIALLRPAIAGLGLLPVTRLRVTALIAGLITRLGRLLVIARRGLRRRRRGDAGLLPLRRLWVGPELPQLLLEQLIAVLQFLVLPGELPKLLFQLLDAHLRIRIIRLSKGLRRQKDQRGDRRGAGQLEEIRRHIALTRKSARHGRAGHKWETEYAGIVTGVPNPTPDRAGQV